MVTDVNPAKHVLGDAVNDAIDRLDTEMATLLVASKVELVLDA